MLSAEASAIVSDGPATSVTGHPDHRGATGPRHSRLCGGLQGLARRQRFRRIREWNPQALDALFGVVQDAGADPKARRKAALKVAEFLLPKVGKKAKVLPDEYGFSVNPNLASAYRDIQLELRALVNGPTRKIPAIAATDQKIGGTF